MLIETNYDDAKKQVIKAYQDLLIVQYYNKNKARAHIAADSELLWANLILLQIRDLCLNVDQSVGLQLDQVGKWVGVDRWISYSRYEGEKWYSYINWSNSPNDLQGGLQDWSNKSSSIDAPFLSYEDIVSSKRRLSDNIFRELIKIKIIKNSINHSPKYIDDALWQLYGKLIYIEWGQCLEMTYCYDSTKAGIIDLALEKKILPCPTGVNLKTREL